MTKKKLTSTFPGGSGPGGKKPKPLSHYVGFAHDHYAKDEIADSLALACEGLEHYPDNVELLTIYGHTLCLFDQPDIAEAPLRAAVALESDYFYGVYSLAQCLQALGKDDKSFLLAEASIHYKRALTLEPDNVRCRYDYATMLMESMDKYEEAGVQFKKVLELEPNNPTAHGNYGFARMMTGLNDKETHRHLRQAWQSGNDDAYRAGFHYVISLLYDDNRPMALMVGEFVLAAALDHNDADMVQNLYKRLPELNPEFERSASFEAPPTPQYLIQ